MPSRAQLPDLQHYPETPHLLIQAAPALYDYSYPQAVSDGIVPVDSKLDQAELDELRRSIPARVIGP